MTGVLFVGHSNNDLINQEHYVYLFNAANSKWYVLDTTGIWIELIDGEPKLKLIPY